MKCRACQIIFIIRLSLVFPVSKEKKLKRCIYLHFILLDTRIKLLLPHGPLLYATKIIECSFSYLSF